MKIHNFCAGPSILPTEVFEEASNAIKDLNGSGLSLLEISHRSHAFVEIMDEARDLSLELLGLSGNDYTALFLQGGASSQFLMVAYNFLRNEAGYLNTGTWSKKAIKEAKASNKSDDEIQQAAMRAGTETLYFIISTLNKLNIDKIRNDIILQVIPVKA